MRTTDVLEMEPVPLSLEPFFESSPGVRGVRRNRRNLSAYCAFIVQRLEEDMLSYKNAGSFVPGVEEKDILEELGDRKIMDIESIVALSPDPSELSRASLTRQASSATQYWLDVEFNPILSLMGALCFAYQREYWTLRVFERFCRLAQEPAVEALFESAVWRQRESILWLDGVTSPARAEGREETVEQKRGRQGVSWALILA